MSLKVIIKTIAINTLLVTEAREINRVTSAEKEVHIKYQQYSLNFSNHK